MRDETIFVGATNFDVVCREGRQMLLDAGYRLVENKKCGTYTEEELKAISENLVGVISGCDVWNETSISNAPRLKVIVKFGVGVDNIDLAAARRHGVQVANCPGVNASAVAEQTMTLLLACLRDIPALDSATRDGAWERRVFPDICGSTFGVLGFGSIGQAVAVRARAFGADVVAYSRRPKPELAERLGVRQVSLEELLTQSDIITAHLPVTADTRHIIGGENIRKLKKGVVIVNTARGGLVCERDVAAAIRSGRIGGFATDVYETEPIDADYPLLRCPHTVFSPHVAGETRISNRNLGIASAERVLCVLGGRPLPDRLA